MLPRRSACWVNQARRAEVALLRTVQTHSHPRTRTHSTKNHAAAGWIVTVTAARSWSDHEGGGRKEYYQHWKKSATMAMASLASAGMGGGLVMVMCEQKKGSISSIPPIPAPPTTSGMGSEDSKNNKKNSVELTPAFVGTEDLDELIKIRQQYDEDSNNNLPVYTMEQVKQNDGSDGKPIWMSYGGVVYNVTDFIVNHPGGSQKIMMAAGSAIEPFWHLYRQHYASQLPMKLMEHMAIGKLDEKDQECIEEQMAKLEEDDPYAHEPMRHKALIVHSDTPMNAETPTQTLANSYLTPNSLFYIRHHHPVPYLSEEQIKDFRLKVDLTACGKGTLLLSLDDLRAMPKAEITATLQCSGNRRSGFNAFQTTSGTPWGQGAVSTASFRGVRLLDLLKKAGLEDPITAQEKDGMNHIIFYGLDGMLASIGIEKGCNPYGDVIICYEMNGEPLPRDHGFPLRVIVPGYVGVRNVKWVERISLSKEEAEGPWQRGLNYKQLPPGITDANGIDVSSFPSMTEASVYSGITKAERASSGPVVPGDRVPMLVTGWAWAGGGRNVVRVDVTGDGGKNWTTSKLEEGANQGLGRAWAWVFWRCEVPAVVLEDGSVQVASKAVDMAYNVQPETSDHSWNVRGLGNNSWYRKQIRVVE